MQPSVGLLNELPVNKSEKNKSSHTLSTHGHYLRLAFHLRFPPFLPKLSLAISVLFVWVLAVVFLFVSRCP